MKKSPLLLLLIIISLPNCASIVSGRNQTVSITTTSKGAPVNNAYCQLSNPHGQWYTSNTPSSVFIRKAYGNMSINCKTDSMVGNVTFKSSHEGIVWGNIIIGGLIGFAIDAGTGAGFSYPQTMNIELSETESN